MRTLLPHRPRRQVTRVIAASHAGVDLTIGAVAGLLPSIRTDLDLTGSQVAVIVTLLAAVSSFGQPVAGRVIDRRGARWPAVTSAAGTAVALGALPIAPSFGALVATAILGGIGAAIYHPAAAALTRSGADERDSATALGLFAAGGTVGLAAGPLLAMRASEPLGSLLPALLALPGILLAVALAVSTASLDESRPLHQGSGTTGVRESLRRTLPLIVAMSGVYLSSITFSTAVPLWLDDIGRPSAIGATLAVFSLSAAAGGIIGGRLTSVTGVPAHASYPMLAAPVALLGIPHTTPGSIAWYLTIAIGGALGSTAIPVVLDAAQSILSGSVASASGLLMGLPIGIASVGYLGLSTVLDRLDITSVSIVSATGTALTALLTHHALTAPNQPRRTRPLPTCPCTSGGLAIAGC